MEGNDFDRFQEAFETAYREVRGDHLIDGLTPKQMNAHISIKQMRDEEVRAIFLEECNKNPLLLHIQQKIFDLREKGIPNTDKRIQKLLKTRSFILLGACMSEIRTAILYYANLEHEEGIHDGLDKDASVDNIVAYLNKSSHL